MWKSVPRNVRHKYNSRRVLMFFSLYCELFVRNWHQIERPDGDQYPPKDKLHIFSRNNPHKYKVQKEWENEMVYHVPAVTQPPLTSLDNFERFTHNVEQRTKTVIRLEGFFGRLFNRMTILTKVLITYNTHYVANIDVLGCFKFKLETDSTLSLVRR